MGLIGKRFVSFLIANMVNLKGISVKCSPNIVSIINDLFEIVSFTCHAPVVYLCVTQNERQRERERKGERDKERERKSDI